MKNRKLIAKSNLKKSLYLGGGMSVFTAAIGLAVSIPVYNKIKKELAQSTSKLKDLSGLMGELTNKLGIPEGVSFQKELEGGYEVVYENGQTKIYKNGKEGKSLIVNMNGDGTVGSAAMGNGPAAQAMLGVIENAKKSMQADQEAMNDIIGPFANQAEDQSLATESAITGVSVNLLAHRNALAAGDDEKAKQAAAKRLADLVTRNKAIADKLSAEDAKRAQALKEQAEADKKAQEDLAAAMRAGNVARLQTLKDNQANAALKVVQDFIKTLDYTNSGGITSVTADAPAIDTVKVLELVDENSGWAKEAGLIVPLATDIDANEKFLDDLRIFLQDKVDAAKSNEQKLLLKKYFQSQQIAAAQTRIDAIKAKVAAEIEKAKEIATERTTDHQLINAEKAGRVTGAMLTLAGSLPNAINSLMATQYGYMKEGIYKPPALNINNIIKEAMEEVGVSKDTINVIEDKIIKPLHDASAQKFDGIHEVQGTVSFSEVVNTFSLKEQSVSRLIVIKATYKNKNNVDVSQLFLANQTTKSPIDFEDGGTKLQSIKSVDDKGIINPMYTAASYLIEAINRNINPSITKDATVALKNVVAKGVVGALKGIKDPNVFPQLVLVAKAIDPTNRPIQEKALVEILLALAKKYLFEGEPVKVNGQEIIDVVNGAMKYDGTKEPTLTLDATDQPGLANYGPLLEMIIKKINKDGDDPFTDYTSFTEGAKATLALVNPKMVSIDKVEQMMDDKDLKNQIKSFEAIEKTPEGKALIADDWKLVFDVMKSNQSDHAIRIIQNQDFSEITSNMKYLKSILAKSLLPSDAATSAVYKSLDRLTTIWGYKGKTGLSDEEMAFRDKIIDEELMDADVQKQLPSGDISFDAISKAFEILAANGYIKSDSNADNVRVKIFEAFMNKETNTKEFSLSVVASLDKYSTGHDELVNGGYINDVIERMLEDEDKAKTYTYAIKQLDLTETILKAAKTDPLADLSFAIPYKEFIFDDKDTTLDLIKSIHRIVNFINKLKDAGSDDARLVSFEENAIKHIFDASISSDIDRVSAYIEYMINLNNKDRKEGDDYVSDTAKEAALHQVEMYGDKFFGNDEPVTKTLGDEADSSAKSYKALLAQAGSGAAKARLKVLQQFATVTDAWQSGFVNAKPMIDPKFASQKEQAIPTKIKSLGFDKDRGVFYMIGTLEGVSSIGGRPKGNQARHQIDADGNIVFDENKANSLFLFEGKLVDLADPKHIGQTMKVMQYHRITEMDFVIEEQYNVGRKPGVISWIDDKDHSKGMKSDNTLQVDHPLSTSSVSTYNEDQHSFAIYGSGNSWGHGHTIFKYINGKWTTLYVDWTAGTTISISNPVKAKGAPNPGTSFKAHGIGDSHYVGMGTLVENTLYALDYNGGMWYKISPNGEVDPIIFSSVPGRLITTKDGATEWNVFPKPNMVGTIKDPIDEKTGVRLKETLAVYVDSNAPHSLMETNLGAHTISDMTLYEIDESGNPVKSHIQTFTGSEAITTTSKGSIYISSGSVSAQQVYRVYLNGGKWMIEEVGNTITDLHNPITSLYHYVDSDGVSYIAAISLDGVKIIKDIFA